ncbi:DUF1127 domain-containing protein [Mesorhizobium xinjiangense]|uniref:DUF1127 domain-containing protein n=1 Tax=Mesorhizobium xinjiangense TaxID=2678685 RepID=UPI0012ECCA67|nr:DUF1127 domain-containing protein [Mesorhizobium xinjiangense]
MSALDHSTIAMPAHARPAFATRVFSRVAAFLRSWKNRRAVYRLGEMTDAQLADIGLTRSDLHVAWLVPFGEDPTATLGSMARARSLEAEDAARRIC